MFKHLDQAQMTRRELSMDYERWCALMGEWGFGQNQHAYDSLVAAYTQNHRFYHTDKHITACLSHLESFASKLDKPQEVELALWFHDAVYNPLSGKNEEKSADWAATFLTQNSAESAAITRVHQLIMVTEHNAPTKTNDESILVDIDLSILGASSKIYDTFEAAVRKEYKFVPWFMYRKKRAAILQGFLERPGIYHAEPFITNREAQARLNLTQAITNLSGRV